MDNIFQNTSINSSFISYNQLNGALLGTYCNFSNITINATVFSGNQLDGLTIHSCPPDGQWTYMEPSEKLKLKLADYKPHWLNRTAFYSHLNVSWSLFDNNRLNGLHLPKAQNIIGLITNNTFSDHKLGAFLITQPDSLTQGDALIRNTSFNILFNKFTGNFIKILLYRNG